jgi:hypothetical protein
VRNVGVSVGIENDSVSAVQARFATTVGLLQRKELNDRIAEVDGWGMLVAAGVELS